MGHKTVGLLVVDIYGEGSMIGAKELVKGKLGSGSRLGDMDLIK